MPAQYLIKKVDTCPVCNGEKMVQHPAWKEYWKAVGHEDFDFMDAWGWFRKHGWVSMDASEGDVPDEEISCGECEGEGEIVSEVDLVEALKDPYIAGQVFGGNLPATA